MSDASLHLIALALFAEINARLDTGESRQVVLTEKGLSEDEFRREQQRWLQLLSSQAEQQQWQLQQRYSAVYSQWRLRSNAHVVPPLPSRIDTLPFAGARAPFTSGAHPGSASMSGTSPGFPGSTAHGSSAFEPARGAAPYEQPKYEQPKYEQPKYEQPKYEQPKYEQPKYEQPKYEQAAVPFPMPAGTSNISPQPTAPAVPLDRPAPFAPAPRQAAAFPGATPVLSATQELVPFPGIAPVATTEQPAFPMPAAAQFVSPKPEPAAFPSPAGPLFVSLKTEQPAPAQAAFPASSTQAGAFPPPTGPLFVSPKAEQPAFPVPAQAVQPSSSAGPPYFSSPVVTRAESFSPAQSPSPAAPIQPGSGFGQPMPGDYPKPTTAAALPSATPPVQAFSASGYFVTNATGAWQAQPSATAEKPAPAGATALPLSFEQLTCLTAEIESNPSRAGAALAGYGIDQSSYQGQLQALRVRCEADPDLQQRYDRLIQYYRAVVAQR